MGARNGGRCMTVVGPVAGGGRGRQVHKASASEAVLHYTNAVCKKVEGKLESENESRSGGRLCAV